MSDRRLKTEQETEAEGATGLTIRPADFPLGSPQSRAAARAALERRLNLSSRDQDALELYQGYTIITGDMNPDYLFLESTDIWKRGKALDELRNGLPALFQPDANHNRLTFASGEFELACGRTPEAGDVLRHTDVEITHNAAVNDLFYGRFIAAWKRQITTEPCPIEMEHGRLFKRYPPDIWREDLTVTPEWAWRDVKKEAGGTNLQEAPDSLVAVVFVGCVDGKHRCRPASEGEAEAPRPTPVGGIIGMLRTALGRNNEKKNI